MSTADDWDDDDLQMLGVEIIADAVDDMLEGDDDSEDDLSGDDDDLDDMEGEDDPEILGRRRGRGRRGRRRVRSRNVGAVMAGIPVTDIASLAEDTIQVDISDPMRPDRLILVTTGMRVKDIKIGSISQNISNDPVPDVVFAFDSINVKLRGNTAKPSVGITLLMTNPTLATETVEGAFIGPAVIVREKN